jgi:hypothetical protein
MNMSDGQQYTHRKNVDRSYDSICLRCFRTVANSSEELALPALENQHKCSGSENFARTAIVEGPSRSRGQHAL